MVQMNSPSLKKIWYKWPWLAYHGAIINRSRKEIA
jgi:hypothetical protein